MIFRRDQLAAYQLAVVVDDDAQGITHVMRGADLLDSTCWQIAIAEALALPVPRHAHLPLVTEPDGSKLAKSRRSVPLDPRNAPTQLVEALSLLQQQPSEGLTTATVRGYSRVGCQKLAAWATGRDSGGPPALININSGRHHICTSVMSTRARGRDE